MDEQRATEEATPAEGLSVRFTLEPDDMRAFMAYNRKHSWQWKRLRILFALVATGLGINHALTRYHQPREQVIGFLSFVILYVGSVWLFMAIVRWFTQRRALTVGEQPGFFCEHTITLFDDALFEETPVNRSEHRWSGIHSVAAGPKHIFIFIAANAAHVVPKRAFADVAAERIFFERAQELYSRAHRG
jgi:hypothetical protein